MRGYGSCALAVWTGRAQLQARALPAITGCSGLGAACGKWCPQALLASSCWIWCGSQLGPVYQGEKKSQRALCAIQDWAVALSPVGGMLGGIGGISGTNSWVSQTLVCG